MSIKGDYKVLLSIYYLLIQMAILGWTVPLSSNISYSGCLAQSTSMDNPLAIALHMLSQTQAIQTPEIKQQRVLHGGLSKTNCLH